MEKNKLNVSVKLTEDGNVVTPFEGNPEYGFIILESTEMVFQNSWLQPKHRTAIIKGETNMLGLAFNAESKLPGKIAVTECLEDDVPQKFVSMFNKENSFEENIEPFIKRAGDGGPVLMSEEKRILRFTEYDASGTQADIRIQHENAEEVLAFNASQKDAKANLSK